MPTLTWLIEHGCELQKPDVALLRAIYEVTEGSPCTACNCKSTCPAWAQREQVVEDSRPRQVSNDGLFCLRCQSPLNKRKAALRYRTKHGGVCPPADRGYCACGHPVYW